MALVSATVWWQFLSRKEKRRAAVTGWGVQGDCSLRSLESRLSREMTPWDRQRTVPRISVVMQMHILRVESPKQNASFPTKPYWTVTSKVLPLVSATMPPEKFWLWNRTSHRLWHPCRAVSGVSVSRFLILIEREWPPADFWQFKVRSRNHSRQKIVLVLCSGTKSSYNFWHIIEFVKWEHVSLFTSPFSSFWRIEGKVKLVRNPMNFQK